MFHQNILKSFGSHNNGHQMPLGRFVKHHVYKAVLGWILRIYKIHKLLRWLQPGFEKLYSERLGYGIINLFYKFRLNLVCCTISVVWNLKRRYFILAQYFPSDYSNPWFLWVVNIRVCIYQLAYIQQVLLSTSYVSGSLMGTEEQRLKRPISPSGNLQGGKLVSNEFP